MEKLHLTATINAPKEKVWHAMLDDATYREWTKPFDPNSHYEGSWDQGSTIRFLGPEEDGTLSGMISRIKENRPYEFLSIEHLGIYGNGIEDTTSEEARKWTPAFENYTFTEVEGGTEVAVELEIAPEHVPIFAESWPEGLERLKAIAERP